MNCLRWYGSSAHFVNCAFDQTRCAAHHFINFAAFDELRNIWSIAPPPSVWPHLFCVLVMRKRGESS